MEKTGKNRYVKHAHISERKFKEILKAFSADLTVQDVSVLCNINRNTINKLYQRIRQRILLINEAHKSFSGEVELDESYFGAKRIRGKRGRGAAGKTPVFGILKRNGSVYVEIVKTVQKRA